MTTLPTGFVEFKIERILAVWENQVRWNLSESGVHPMTTRDLIPDEAARRALDDIEINYPQANGQPELRDAIAALYPGATRDNVLVTIGAIQANLTALLTVTSAGDDVAVMQPNYQQFWGLAQNLDRRLATFTLDRERDWALDRDSLAAAVSPSTKLVTIVNPNNPTGRIMLDAERAAVIEAAAGAGAWLLADEVYAGAERVTDTFTPTFYGHYDKLIAINSTSKAYGLPGLRIGWMVAPAELIERAWAWQDYLTICTTMLSNTLATVALSPGVRPRILERTRAYVRRGFETVQRWAEARDDVQVTAPDAAAVCFVKYRQPVNSTELVMRLVREQSTFAAPGDVFGLDGYLRVSFGLPEDYVGEGLRRIGLVLDDLR